MTAQSPDRNPERRAILLGLAGLGASHLLPQSASSTAGGGYVLGAVEGERLIHFRDHGEVFIKIAPSTGSNNVAMGTQQVMAGTGVPIHRHFHMDEAFYVLAGSGTFILNDVDHPLDKDATIFIPRNSWHGFLNPDHELLLLWVVSPPGLEGFFRETCTPPGVPPRQLTHEQMNAIARKYGTEFR